MRNIEILNLPSNIESIEIIIEEEIDQNQEWISVIKRNFWKYRWEIFAGFCVACAVVIGLCLFFLFGNSEATTTTTTTTPKASVGIDLTATFSEKIETTSTTTTTTTIKTAVYLDEIINPF